MRLNYELFIVYRIILCLKIAYIICAQAGISTYFNVLITFDKSTNMEFILKSNSIVDAPPEICPDKEGFVDSHASGYSKRRAGNILAILIESNWASKQVPDRTSSKYF